MSEANLSETKNNGRINIRNNMRIRYWRNYPLRESNTAIKRAVIVVHGKNRNADNYFSYIMSAASKMGCVTNTLILAPNFITSEDNPRSDELYWSEGGWKQGDPSWDIFLRISSFSVMDRILRKLGKQGKFPNLERVVIIGHSAGGQFVNRYAAGSKAEDMSYMSGVHVRYIIANPSTYMYLNGTRKMGDIDDVFSSVPSGQSCGGKYDDYKYGLRRRNPYMRQVSMDRIRTQYTSRDVIYLLGQQDTGSGSLDQSCPAMLQGENRLERGRIFYNHICKYYNCPSHSLEEIPGVGHNSNLMFNSQTCMSLVFGD
jgi:pimeloyl-ACP methyl ester carboxylesterase